MLIKYRQTLLLSGGSPRCPPREAESRPIATSANASVIWVPHHSGMLSTVDALQPCGMHERTKSTYQKTLMKRWRNNCWPVCGFCVDFKLAAIIDVGVLNIAVGSWWLSTFENIRIGGDQERWCKMAYGRCGVIRPWWQGPTELYCKFPARWNRRNVTRRTCNEREENEELGVRR